MTIIQRFKRLSIWNKLAVFGSIASIIALVLYFFPVTDSNHPANLAQVAGNNSMQIGNIAGNVVINASPPIDDKHDPLKLTPSPNLDTVETVFPMYIGSYWRYSIAVVEQYKGTKIRKQVGHYTEKIMFIDTKSDNSTRIIGTEIIGNKYFPRCNDNDTFSLSQGDIPYWYITDIHFVYHACSRENAYEIADSIHTDGEATINTSGESSSEDSPEKVYPDYVVPFKVGNYWADEGINRKDTWYRYYVEAEENVNVPAGNFKNCFRVAYRTLSSSEVSWVCPGIGLVAEEYHHNGSIEDYRVELINYQIVPK